MTFVVGEEVKLWAFRMACGQDALNAIESTWATDYGLEIAAFLGGRFWWGTYFHVLVDVCLLVQALIKHDGGSAESACQPVRTAGAV